MFFFDYSNIFVTYGVSVHYLMFRKLSIILTGIFLSCAYLSAQKACVFAGSVLDNSTGKPVEFATVMLEGTEQWAVADLQGRFSISNVPSGKTGVTIA